MCRYGYCEGRGSALSQRTSGRASRKGRAVPNNLLQRGNSKIRVYETLFGLIRLPYDTAEDQAAATDPNPKKKECRAQSISYTGPHDGSDDISGM